MEKGADIECVGPWVPDQDEPAAECTTYSGCEPPFISDTCWFKMWKWVFGQANSARAKKSLLGWWLKGWIVRIYLTARLCQLLGVSAHLDVWVPVLVPWTGVSFVQGTWPPHERPLEKDASLFFGPFKWISLVYQSNMRRSQILKGKCLEIGSIDVCRRNIREWQC